MNFNLIARGIEECIRMCFMAERLGENWCSIQYSVKCLPFDVWSFRATQFWAHRSHLGETNYIGVNEGWILG